MNSIQTAAGGADMRGAGGFLNEEGGPRGKRGFPGGASPEGDAS
jgi:hypothetical protein